MDRIFPIESIKGKPKFLVKTVLNEMQKSSELRNQKYVNIISKIIHLRKLLIIYRLLHHADRIEEMNLNIDGRALELTSPQIYLFSSHMAPEKKALAKILPALSKFLRKKGELAQKTIDGVAFEALNELFLETEPELTTDPDWQNKIRYKISHKDIVNKIRQLAEGIDSTIPNEQAFYSTDYGKVTYKHVLKIYRDRFFGRPSSIGVGRAKERALTFDKDTVEIVGKAFEVIDEIEILTEPRDYDYDDTGHNGDEDEVKTILMLDGEILRLTKSERRRRRKRGRRGTEFCEYRR